jgi:hypothetical protein
MLKKMQVTEQEGQLNISGKNHTINTTTLLETLSNFTVLHKYKKQLAEDRIIKHHLLCV